MIKEFKGWHMAVITTSFFGVIIGVNLTLGILAKTSWTGLVVPNSYVASQHFNRDAAEARRQHAVGWQLKLDTTSGPLTLAINDKSGQAVKGLAVRALIQHPVSVQEDKTIALQETTPGRYSTTTALGSGAWVIDVTAVSSDGNPVRFVERIVVK